VQTTSEKKEYKPGAEATAASMIGKEDKEGVRAPSAPPSNPPEVREQLYDAANNNNTEKARELLSTASEEDVNYADPGTGYTPLIMTSGWGNEEIAELLVCHGADVNKISNYGGTPLMRASWKGHLKMIKKLLEWGADDTIKDNIGETAFDRAKENGKPECVKVLESAAPLKERLLALKKKQTEDKIEMN